MRKNQQVVTISAPSRLELTLIDLSLHSRRVNGSVGIAISRPSFECRVTAASEVTIVGNGFEYVCETQEFLTTLLRDLGCDPVRIDVTSRIPPHRGFGSKTATLLAVGRATATLYGKDISTSALAQLAKRARTSGVGVNTFDRGGFLIDGGHPAEPEVEDSGDRFVPTRYSSRTHIPRAIFSQNFPWPILIILPRGVIVEGQVELERFRAICPFPRASVHEIAYITCFQMATAVVESDYTLFCSAVNDLQLAYLKAHELRFQSEQVRYVQSQALSHGVDAIGLSSNGPALYAFSRSRSVVESWLNGLLQDRVIESYWWTRCPTSGAIIRHEGGVTDSAP